MFVKNLVNIHEGEEMVAMYTSLPIADAGIYTFIAKKRKDGTYQWVHYVQKFTGAKESMYNGHVKTMEQVNMVLSIINNNLANTFGAAAEMKAADITYTPRVRIAAMAV